MKNSTLIAVQAIALLLFWSITAKAQSPNLDAWLRNTTGLTASYWENSNGNPNNPSFVFHTTTDSANVLSVCYDNSWIYVRSDGMTTDMGQFLNPGSPSAQNYTFSFPKTPSAAAVPTAVPVVFATGVLINGIPFFGNSNANSWSNQSQSNSQQGQHLWNVDAWYGEGFTLDTAFSAHPQQDGAYHSHATPHRLYDFPSTSHSPIVGFAFDGYPVYGPYGYTSAMNASSGISQMSSSYQLRTMTTRHTLPDGTVLAANQYGPNVSTSHPLGEYIEDYEYVAGLGDLDANNGRTCVTPEYPNGTYAYFVAADGNDDPVYPYYLGAAYHGNLDTNNISITSTITIPSGVTCLSGVTSVAEAQVLPEVTAYPSLVANAFTLKWETTKVDRLVITDLRGQVVSDIHDPRGSSLSYNTSAWADGMYNCALITAGHSHSLRIVVQH